MSKEIQSKITSNFYVLLIGQIISIFGSSLLRFAFSLYVLKITGREDIFALLLAASYAPQLMSPIAGAIADCFNRKKIIIYINAVNALLVLCFIVFLGFDRANTWLIGTIMLLLGVVAVMEPPTVSACVPLLVAKEKLEQANGMVSGVGAVAGILAPVAGGGLYISLGIELLAMLCCIAFFAAAVMTVFIKIPDQGRSLNGKIFSTIGHDMLQGFHFLVNESLLLKAMGLAAILNLLITPFFIVGTPIVLYKTLHSDNSMYGLGLGLLEFATIAGALSIGLFSKRLEFGVLHRWIAAIAFLLLPMAFSLTQSMLSRGYYISYMLYFLCAIPMVMILTMISIYAVTVIQKRTPNELLGKVMANIMAVSQCAAPVGQIMYGFLFKHWSSSTYLIVFILSTAMFITAIGTKYVTCSIALETSQ